MDDYAELTLLKVSSGKKVSGSLAKTSTDYFENDTDGNVYIAMVFDYTNLTGTTLEVDEIVELKAVGPGKTVFTDSLYAVEKDDGSSFSASETIAPLSTDRLQCAVSVPENAKEYTLELTVDGHVYTYSYVMNETDSSAKPIEINQKITGEDFAEITMTSLAYTSDLLPSDTSGYYSHYEVDNPSNTYLVASFDVTNLSEGDLIADKILSVSALYKGKYTYSGFTVLEEDDGTDFSPFGDIVPLSHGRLFCLIEVPKSVESEEVTLTVLFNRQEYTYKGIPS